MLEVHNLTKRFGSVAAVDQVSFRVEPGDAFGLLGPNGAGKSTTISLISGLLVPDEGEISIHGRTLREHPQYVKSRIGLVPQTIALYENLTARENLAFWGAVYGVAGQRLKDAIKWCLDVAGLADQEKLPVRKYSGGMKRRLNIAVGMIHRPEVLIMDEPTVGIDPQSRNHILETIRRLNADGMTVIYTSHYMEEVQFLCKRLAIMDHGRVIAYGNLEDVKQLAGSLATIQVEANGPCQPAEPELAQDPALRSVKAAGNALTVLAADAASAVSKVVVALARHNLSPVRIQVQEPNLETAFLHLTGRNLRDGEEGGAA